MKHKGKEVYFSGEQYFEGILQLRNPDDAVLEFVEQAAGRHPKASISKITKVKNGFDYYITSSGFLRSLGKKLADAFPGELKSTRRLYSLDRQSSKAVYRACILFRRFDAGKGDTVTYKGERMAVVSAGRKLRLMSPVSKKKISVRYDDPYLSSGRP